MFIAGIDPGKQGAIVILHTNDTVAFKYKLKYPDGDLCHNSVHDILSLHRPGLIIIEKVQGFKGASATSTFNFGYAVGQLNLAVRASNIPYKLITPQRWQKELHVGIKGSLSAKERTMAAYRQMFPHEPIPKGPRGGKIDDNVLDAFVIAVYGVIKYGNRIIRKWEFVS